MAVPPFPAFIDPLLRILAASPEGVQASAAHEAAAARLGLTEAQRSERLPSMQQATFKNRSGWAHDRLKRAGLSESSTFGTWRLTKAGVAFVNAHPDPLSESEIAKITDLTEPRQSIPWLDRLSACRADAAWMADREAILALRQVARPAIAALVNRYLRAETTLEDFRSTFDKKTRREWDCFGAKGLNGAMVLNKLAKHAPDLPRVDRELRALLAVSGGRGRRCICMRRFATYLQEERAKGAVSLPPMPASRSSPACSGTCRTGRVAAVLPVGPGCTRGRWSLRSGKGRRRQRLRRLPRGLPPAPESSRRLGVRARVAAPLDAARRQHRDGGVRGLRSHRDPFLAHRARSRRGPVGRLPSRRGHCHRVERARRPSSVPFSRGAARAST
ncbi:MAG: hypothetical protein IPJ34_42255 [Myxococcales bacterium]|nr:hypothetical protein [Myxococcales bacterium]